VTAATYSLDVLYFLWGIPTAPIVGCDAIQYDGYRVEDFIAIYTQSYFKIEYRGPECLEPVVLIYVF
jgi:hypothetical protein